MKLLQAIQTFTQLCLGQADYPKGVLLMLKVSAGLTPDAHLMSFPSIGTIEMPDRQRPQTSFIVPGMIFTLVLRSNLTEGRVRQGCLIRGTGHLVFVLNTDELFFREMIILAPGVTPSQKIIDEVHSLWREALRSRS